MPQELLYVFQQAYFQVSPSGGWPKSQTLRSQNMTDLNKPLKSPPSTTQLFIIMRNVGSHEREYRDFVLGVYFHFLSPPCIVQKQAF